MFDFFSLVIFSSCKSDIFVVVRLLNCLQLFATPCNFLHTRLPCLSLSLEVFSNSRLLSWWCHLPISSSVAPYSAFSQSFPASGSFPMSRLFASGGQSIGASTSASVLPMNIQGLFPLGLTGLISLLFKGLSRVFSRTTVQDNENKVS